MTSFSCFFLDYFGVRSYNRYSTTSVYTELRDGAREGDDGSRLLTIENHLGVPVVVTLEDEVSEGDEELSVAASASSMQEKARPFRMKKAGYVVRRGARKGVEGGQEGGRGEGSGVRGRETGEHTHTHAHINEAKTQEGDGRLRKEG